MNTNSALKFIGYIEYKDLLDPETINKYDDSSVLCVKDIPANKSDRNVFIDGIEINEINSISIFGLMMIKLERRCFMHQLIRIVICLISRKRIQFALDMEFTGG